MIHDHDIPFLISYVINTIENAEGFHVEYFNIVDDEELIPVNTKVEMKKGKRYFGCVAVKAGKIRLIDNIEIPL
jgi:pantothenate synthetase